MRIAPVLIARTALVLILATIGLNACNTPNPTVTDPGLQQDRAGKDDEKDKSTKDQNPTKPAGL